MLRLFFPIEVAEKDNARLKSVSLTNGIDKNRDEVEGSGPGEAIIYRVLKRNFQVGYFLYISLSCEAEITKLHMGILLTIMDNIIPKIIVPASIWPQQRLSSQASQKYIVPTIT